MKTKKNAPKKSASVKQALLGKKKSKRAPKVELKRFETLGFDSYQQTYGNVGAASVDSRFYTDSQLRGLLKNSTWDYSTKTAAMKSLVEDSHGKVTTADMVALLKIMDPAWEPAGRLAVFFSYRRQWKIDHNMPVPSRG